MTIQDQQTADKFATSWNNVYDASVYTEEQFFDWIDPIKAKDIEDKEVLELGCGSGALLFHMAKCKPKKLTGVDLGSSVNTATKLMEGSNTQIMQGDLTDHNDLSQKIGQQDLTYSIGVIHHLTEPEKGFNSLIHMTKAGGHFHGWVYAHEGNAVVRYIVDPIRKIVNHFPWFINKYAIAMPLSIPFFLYSNFCRLIHHFIKKAPLPLFDYMLWVSKRDFRFHHHVAFDQLVTPMTHYIRKETIEAWLNDPKVEKGSSYVIFRNGNGWKFGGKIKSDDSFNQAK